MRAILNTRRAQVAAPASDLRHAGGGGWVPPLHSVLVGDFDEDGHQDVYLTRGEAYYRYHNNTLLFGDGRGSFRATNQSFVQYDSHELVGMVSPPLVRKTTSGPAMNMQTRGQCSCAVAMDANIRGIQI